MASLEALVELRGEAILSVLDGMSGLPPLHYAARGGAAALPSLRWLLARPSVRSQVNRGPVPLPVLPPPPPRPALSGGRRTRSAAAAAPQHVAEDSVDDSSAMAGAEASEVAPAEFVDHLPKARRRHAAAGNGVCVASTPLHLACSYGTLVPSSSQKTSGLAQSAATNDERPLVLRYGRTAVSVCNQDSDGGHCFGRERGCIELVDVLINAGAWATSACFCTCWAQQLCLGQVRTLLVSAQPAGSTLVFTRPSAVSTGHTCRITHDRS